MASSDERIRRRARLSNRLGGRAGARRFTRFHAALYRASGGRLGKRWMGSPVIVLETVGRRSGQLRRTPVLGLGAGSGFIVLAANAGADRTPAWYLNLRAAGRAVVIARGSRLPVAPRELHGSERDAAWERFAAMHPATDHYATYTDRELPLVALEPVAGEGDPTAAQ